ncbi:BID domain-containing T4SS effector [Bartonella krasnovii]|uniref:BID domain-containing T4SS effector n=1 Tax=Bartonella krasnovii TaxID=2267275 RepID=UPI001F4CC8F8|nr:BID domain-containing T4SS effector [Bartonella krasnovii]UNF36740.1 BID domain-containing T4SS effector [Bartonella krasnovii]
MPKAKEKSKNIDYPSPHNYLYPGTQILKNKYEETDLERFREKCSHGIEKGLERLRRESLPEHFDSFYLSYIHYHLFKETFVWSGQIRATPVTFADGSVAATPEIKRTEWDNTFVNAEKTLDGLKKIEKTLAEKDNLKGLTREDFISETVPLFVSLKKIHPFIDGNEHTIQFFFENLAKSAGHHLDFSLTTQERMMTAYTQAAHYGNAEPMRDLFEDISHPEKICLLQEFMNNMKKSGRDVNDHLVMVAKEDETYTGIYRGALFDSFMLDVEGIYIIGRKTDLTIEQQKTLKPSDKLTFTPPKTELLEKILIPEEKLAPLTKNEKAGMIAEDACVQTARNQIQQLANIVYGNAKTLDKQMVGIINNPQLGQRLANQIERTPDSVAHLAGLSLCGLQSPARANAKNHLEMLCTAVVNFTHAVKHAEKEITQEHTTEQARRAKTVQMPSQSLQNFFALPKELQQESLAKNLGLQKELTSFVKKINSRLSENEHKAVKNNDYETLAQSIGVSENKAKQITQTIKQAKEAHQQACTRTANRSNVLAMAS